VFRFLTKTVLGAVTPRCSWGRQTHDHAAFTRPGLSAAGDVARGVSSPASLEYISDFRESYAFAAQILTPLGY
jgi:hypothetical protein